MEIYGYARVSTKDQKEDRQLSSLGMANVPKKNIYVDKQSGKDFDRPQYLKLTRRLKENDLLIIKSIDRLGRDYEEIQKQWRILTKEKHVDIVVLDMPLLDTRRGKDLLGTFLSDVVLQVLSFVAENERKNIRVRQREGIAEAKARGVKFGRPQKPPPEGYDEAFRRWAAGEITGTMAAGQCGMALSSFLYRAGREKKPSSNKIHHTPQTPAASGMTPTKSCRLFHFESRCAANYGAPALVGVWFSMDSQRFSGNPSCVTPRCTG